VKSWEKEKVFKYIEKFSKSNKPVKATRLRNKDSKDEEMLDSKALGIGLYVLSFLCLILVIVICL